MTAAEASRENASALRYDYSPGALSDGVRNESVPVVVFSGEGNEAGAGRNIPRVRGNRPDLRAGVPGKYLASNILGQFRHSPEHIFYHPVRVVLNKNPVPTRFDCRRVQTCPCITRSRLQNIL